jgi:WD40 repeat protein
MIKEIYGVGVNVAVNKVAFDPGASVVAAGLDDGNLKFLYCNEQSKTKDVVGTDGAIQALAFDKSAAYLVVAGSGT